MSHDTTQLSVGALTAEQAAHNAAEQAADQLTELDAALFTAPYILIDATNRSVATAATAAEAWTLLDQLPHAATIVGTAHPGVEVIDIDPADTDAPAEAGEAAVEWLRDWCTSYGLPYQRRASGRPGGHHLVAVVPPELVAELADQVSTAAEHHHVAIALRRPATLRLLAAPHRLGLPAPLLDGTLRASDVPTRHPEGSPGTRPPGRTCKPTAPAHPRTSSTRRSASEREFGRTCAAVRRGLSFRDTWALVGTSQVAARGQLDFRQYMWLPAVTIVAAERGLDESAAWALAHEACAVRARRLGRPAWRQRYWLPAVDQAARDRPRRRRLHDGPMAGSARPNDRDPKEHQNRGQRQDVEQIRCALHAATTELLGQYRPQRQRSIRAVLDALADALATRDGSIDVRTLAERSRVSKSVTIEVMKDLTEQEIIAVAEHYSGGADHCHRYALGSRVAQPQPETGTTRWYTPTPAAPSRSYGQANPAVQRRQHQQERHVWGLRCQLQQATQRTGERWSTSQHPAAKTARSLWAQRQRWTALSEEDQATRRRERRAYLGTLGAIERRAWFDWLSRRDDLSRAAERARHGTATRADLDQLGEAPCTVHLGMREHSWLSPARARRPEAEQPPQLGLDAGLVESAA